MKTVIHLKICDGNLEIENVMPYDFNNLFEGVSFELNIPNNISFDEVFRETTLKKLLKKELKNMTFVGVIDEYPSTAVAIIELLEKNILSTIEYIELENKKEAGKYVRKNPSISAYPLVLEGVFDINNKALSSIDESIITLENLKMFVDGNQQMVTVAEYKKTIDAINEIVTKIKKYNLSPLEQIMYAYDLVRDRVYTKENSDENYYTSRDLTKVLLGNKIVCLGFANILNQVLKNINIKSEVVTLIEEEKNMGHARNIVYVKDDKYDVEAVYYLDPTWDSRKENDSTNYLNSYNYFCRTKFEMDNLSKRKGHSYTYKKYGDFTEDTAWETIKIAKSKGIQAIPKNIANQVNEISNFIDEKDLIKTIIAPFMSKYIKNSFSFEEIIDKLCYYSEIMYGSALAPEDLSELLINVRKIEYYEDPSKYPYDIESIKKVVILECLENEGGIPRIFRQLLDRKMLEEDFDEISKKNKYEKEIGQVKLVKVLKRISEKKVDTKK